MTIDDDDEIEHVIPICRHCLVDIEQVTDGDGGRWWRHKATESIYCSVHPNDSRATPRVRLRR